MDKKLVYYFYLTDGFKDNAANRINFECLRRYAGVFDSADIYLSTDDITDVSLIKDAERVFLDMPFNGNISFKVIKNTKYCESMVIKNEIFDKIQSLDCLLFFAHAKGYSSIETYKDTNPDGIRKWIAGCYFLSLEYISEMEKMMDESSNYSSFVYGSFPVVSDHKIKETELSESVRIFPGNIKYNWFFSGTFFWINTVKLYNYIHVFSPEMPKMDSRYFGERMFGNIFPFERNASGHNMRYLFPCNFYNAGVVENCLNFILEGSEHEKFDEFYKSIISKA